MDLAARHQPGKTALIVPSFLKGGLGWIFQIPLTSPLGKGEDVPIITSFDLNESH